MVNDNNEEIAVEQMAQLSSTLTVTFERPGSVIFEMSMSNILPMQLIALARYLQLMGENILMAQEAERARREAATKLVIPEGKFVRKH